MRAAVVKFIAKHHHPRRIEFERDSSVNSVVSVCRIFIPQLASLAANYATTDENCRSIVQFVLGIKQLVRDIHATVAFTLDPKSCPFIILQRLKWTADTVLAIDSFSGKEQSVPYEFKEFCGLLTVTRVQQVGSISSFRPPGSKFGLKRDSRKLHIEPLHLPPEESRTGTAGTAAAVTTAARDGFAAEIVPSSSTPATPENKGRIELKMDTSTTALPAPTSSSKLGTSDAPTLSHSNLYSDVRTPSKYEDKGIYDKDDVGNGNIAARSIFARAREQGLLPGARGIESLSIAGSATKQRAPPLLPGSACAPNRPGSDKSTSLDF